MIAAEEALYTMQSGKISCVLLAPRLGMSRWLRWASVMPDIGRPHAFPAWSSKHPGDRLSPLQSYIIKKLGGPIRTPDSADDETPLPTQPSAALDAAAVRSGVSAYVQFII